MADSNEATPTKIFARNPVCMLCSESKDSRHVVKIFSKAGVSQELCRKVEYSCGISIADTDTKSKVLCRACITFLNRMYQFIIRARSLQNNDDDIPGYAVKRCVQMSPSSSQQSKRLTSGPSRSAKQLFYEEGQGPTSILPNPNQCPDGPVNVDRGLQLSAKQQQMIVCAVNCKDAFVLATILKEHCANVVDALLKLLRKDIRSSCSNLCKRSGGSVLYGNNYESLKDFSFDSIWKEFTANFPFLVELMNAIVGNDLSCIEDTNRELRVKYSFLYSILMNERWHELSLVKRVNTVLVIEGGCTKQVLKYFMLLMASMLVTPFKFLLVISMLCKTEWS